MKTIALTLITASAAFAATEAVIPQGFSKERYEETRTASPFVLATKVEAEKPVDEPKPFANLYVVGLGRAEGKEYVTIIRVGEEATPIRLWGNTPDEDGLSVKQVIWSDAFGKSKVKLKKGTEEGDIGFNENAVRTATAGVPVPQPQGNRPPLPGQATPPGFNRPTNAPPQPGVNPNIPRPGGTTPNSGITIPRPPGVTTPPPNNTNNNNNGGGRQRIRVINNK